MDYVSVLSLIIFLVHGISFGYQSRVSRENSKLSFQDIALSHCGILYIDYDEFQEAYAADPECSCDVPGSECTWPAAPIEWLDYTQNDWDTLSTVFETDGSLVIYNELLDTQIQEGRLLITINPSNNTINEEELAKDAIVYIMEKFWESVTDIKFIFSETYLTYDFVVEYRVSPWVDIAAFASYIDENSEFDDLVLVNPNVNFTNLVMEWLDKESNSWFSVQSYDEWEAHQRHLEYIGYDEIAECLPEWKPIKVGVVDNGFDLTHADLQGTLLDGYDEADKDDNAQVPKFEPAWNHGVKMQWIIRAVHNDVWVRGVVPNAELIVIKSTKDTANGRDITNGIEAIAKAYERWAQVINMSRGGFWEVAMLERVTKKVASKGVVLVAAAGNYNKSAPFYPAAYDWVIGVAAIDDQWNKASFSNYGPWVDVAAPWVDILTTDLDNTYNKYNGTSEASPIVAWAIALAMSHGYTWSDIQNNLSINNQNDIGEGSLDIRFLCEAIKEREAEIAQAAVNQEHSSSWDESTSNGSSFVFPDISLLSITKNQTLDYMLFIIVFVWVLNGLWRVVKSETV